VRIGIWEGELYTSNVFYAKLADAGVPAPLVLAYDDTKRVIPFEYQVVEHLEGVDLRQVPEPLRHRAGQLVGEALGRAHAITIDGFGAPLAQGGWSSPTWLEALRTTYFDSSLERKRELFSEDEIARIEAATVFNPRLDVQSPKLIHADVGPGNGLFRVTGEQVELAGLIDPGPIIGGDPLIDLPSGEDAFSRGVRSAWRSGWPLDGDALYRHERYQLFFSYWTTCWECATGREHLRTRERTLDLLGRLLPPA
jgi:aminoglycoside phosphotransferase (APT) family kinase protein